jgi:hypothetical protein
MSPALLALQASARPAAAAAIPTGPEEEVLDTDLREILGAVVERMVETGEPEAPSAAEVGAVARIEQLLSVLDPEIVDPLKVLLRVVDLWPAVVQLRFRRFRSLSDEEKDESLEGWLRSRFRVRRNAFYALRNLALFGYWTDESTWPLIGYPGPWIGRRS